eukprot:TRINITY_DN6432_c0_g1_i2.p2 TRINITY_DN6432_c0_g1~~TRINITY_DN6432_c0_g1_i2.p2  ORF type:complete len:309 (-),score=65.58 TRINITY_DN6432_c0_g1_i2:31-957(-)
MINFVALYVSQLPSVTPDDKKVIVKVYADFIRGLKKENYKSVALGCAKNFNLDVGSIKIAIFDEKAKLSEKAPQISSRPQEHKPPGDMGESDLLKIRSLEELCISRDLSQDLLGRANDLIINYIGSSQIQMAILAHQTISKYVPSKVQGLPEILVIEYEMLGDYLKFLQLLKAFYESFPENDSTLKGSSEHPHLGTPKYKDIYESLLDSANAILRFPGGWMNFSQGEDEFKKDTQQLRRKIIPQLCFSLFDVHKRVGKYWESVNLVTLVMDPHYALYQTFTNENLKYFLSRVRSDFIILWENRDEILF